MAGPVENYVPVSMAARMRRHAFRVWAAFSLLVLLWVLLIAAAPLAAFYGRESFSTPVYTFFSYICHQIPERSLHLAGHRLGVCSRCFGVYFGLFLGFAAYPLWRKIDDIDPLPRFWLFLSMVPIGIDWSLGVFGIWENTHLSRVITGVILGFACATYIIPALVEIFRYMLVRPDRPVPPAMAGGAM